MSKASEGNRSCDRMIKLLLIGNSGVGKSSILLQYSDKKFVHNYYNTIGVDYKIKFMNIRGLNIKLQIWDTAGQDRFKTITSSYYRGADGIIIVYDITDRSSFDNVKNWLEEIDKFVDERTIKCIVGNKSDLQERRQVSTQQAKQFSNKIGTPFRETSARLATNVEPLFEELVEMILNNNGGTISGSKKSIGQSPSKNMISNQSASPPKNEGVNIKQMLQQKKKEEQGGCCIIY